MKYIRTKETGTYIIDSVEKRCTRNLNRTKEAPLRTVQMSLPQELSGINDTIQERPQLVAYGAEHIHLGLVSCLDMQPRNFGHNGQPKRFQVAELVLGRKDTRRRTCPDKAAGKPSISLRIVQRHKYHASSPRKQPSKNAYNSVLGLRRLLTPKLLQYPVSDSADKAARDRFRFAALPLPQ